MACVRPDGGNYFPADEQQSVISSLPLLCVRFIQFRLRRKHRGAPQSHWDMMSKFLTGARELGRASVTKLVETG